MIDIIFDSVLAYNISQIDNKRKMFLFEDDLSIGNIDKNNFLNAREEFLVKTLNDQTLGSCVIRSYSELECFIREASCNEEIIIWIDEDSPSDMCNMLFIISELYNIHNVFDNIKINCLADYFQCKNSTVVTYDKWSDVSSEEIGQIIYNGNLLKRLSQVSVNKYIFTWMMLQEENADLRVILNGNIISVREDFFDEMLKKYINKSSKFYEKGMDSIVGNFLFSNGRNLRVNEKWCRYRIGVINNDIV